MRGKIILIALCLLFFQQTYAVSQDQKAEPSEYKIGIGDVLEIVTWKEPDFSRDEILCGQTEKYHFRC
jgi:polysaccharide export outer membrane protein